LTLYTDNKYGLSRDIPEPIQRQVRQRCGFGCVVCGLTLYQYHHFDPTYVNAREHNPAGIVLLCAGCHDKLTRGRLSEETLIKAAYNPKCLEEGYSHHTFDIGEEAPVVIFGHATFIRTPIILEVFGTPLFQVEAPETTNGPFRISALFFDKTGNRVGRIVRNEWQGLVRNWDIETVGKKITVRYAHKEIALVIRTEPPNKLIVEHLEMYFKGCLLIGKEDVELSAYLPDGTLWFRFVGVTVENCTRGIVLTK
jgi:hypothetical protein